MTTSDKYLAHRIANLHAIQPIKQMNKSSAD